MQQVLSPLSNPHLPLNSFLNDTLPDEEKPRRASLINGCVFLPLQYELAHIEKRKLGEYWKQREIDRTDHQGESALHY